MENTNNENKNHNHQKTYSSEIENHNLSALEHILNGLSALVYVTDPTNNEILFMNKKMREIFGFDEYEGIGKKCWEILQPNMDDQCQFCPLHRLKDHPDETIEWEERNGVIGRYFRNSDNYIEWTDGRRVHMQNKFDITEMKELADTQQKLMSTITQNFISDNYNTEIVSKSLEMVGEFMGYSRVTLSFFYTEKNIILATHEWSSSDAKLNDSEKQIPFKPGEYLYDRIIKEQKTIISRNDSEIIGSADADIKKIKSSMTSPIYYKEQLIGVVNFCIDKDNYLWNSGDKHLVEFLAGMAASTFARKQAEENINKLSTLVENVMQPIVYTDREENITYYNKATYKLFGYTKEELDAGGVGILFDEETFNRVTKEIWPKAFTDGMAVADLPLRHKNGEVKIFSFLGVVINTDGELPQLATIGTDITALVEAKQAAEAGSKAKTDFLSRMSHEIRTPMNAIIGMNRIAMDSDDLATVHRCSKKIEDASKHLLGIINDILDMSKIEADKFEISPTEFNFEKMLMNITNIVNIQMDDKGHNFVVKLESPIAHSVIGDEQRLSQVIVNFLSNAVKFTPDGGTITLDIDRVELEDNKEKLMFMVSDNGIGISPEQQKKLFKSFEQADGSISRRFGGTGLGLAISKRIIEMMGGQISIESEEGHGTTIKFDVIVGKGSQRNQKNISKKINSNSLRILAVDDSLDTREYISKLMERLDLDCDVAESGKDALDMISVANQNGLPYNFFLIDWMMPEMDGIELSSLIKGDVGAEAIIIMISAAQWAEIETDAKKVGIDGYIAKPLFPSAVVDCVNGYLTTEKVEKKEGESSEGTDFSKYKILLVEDVDINREIVIELLKDTNVKIDIAENGVEALEKLDENNDQYDLIFMDIHMPIMDGYEATREIRKRFGSAGKRTPIIAMTANAFNEDVERCLASGMDDHISKPIDYNLVITKMQNYLH